jgi:hypothetical protein
LKEHAIQKVVTLEAADKIRARALGKDPNEYRSFDAIEVHLGYPIKLRKALQLSIASQEMLYFKCSCLTDADLEIARISVKDQIGSDENFLAYLIEQDKWNEALKTKYPKAVEAIETEYKLSDDDTEVAIKTKQKALKLLSKELLRQPEAHPVLKTQRKVTHSLV